MSDRMTRTVVSSLGLGSELLLLSSKAWSKSRPNHDTHSGCQRPLGMIGVTFGHSVGYGGSHGSLGKCPAPTPFGPAAVKEAAVQRKHNLYRDSMVMHNSDPNLHLLAEGAPIDWGEEYSGSGEDSGSPSIPEAATLSEKRRRAKQVVSVVQDEEAGLPFEAGPEPPSPASPDSVTELRGLLARDLQAESPLPAGPLPNGAPAQESPQLESLQSVAAPEASSPLASPLQQIPPGKAVDLEPPKPSDQETGEQVSNPGGRPPIHTTTEDSAGVQTEF